MHSYVWCMHFPRVEWSHLLQSVSKCVYEYFLDLIPFLTSNCSKLVDKTPIPKVESFKRVNMELHLESLKYKAQYLSKYGALQELPKEGF